MKQTLLEIVQEILESMESDAVDSISDTGESMSVAHIVRRAYWDMIGPLDLPEHYTFFELEASSSATPTIMYLPSNILKLESIKYNTIGSPSDVTDVTFKEIDFQDLGKFMDRQLLLHESDSNVDSFDISNITYLINNDAAPLYFTTPDDYTIIFNSYDVAVEANLQKSKTQCYGLSDPVFTLADTFTPDLDSRQFPLLVNEAKSLAFAELKQTVHARAEKTARKQWVSSQRTKRAISKRNELDFLPNYGRKR